VRTLGLEARRVGVLLLKPLCVAGLHAPTEPARAPPGRKGLMGMSNHQRTGRNYRKRRDYRMGNKHRKCVNKICSDHGAPWHLYTGSVTVQGRSTYRGASVHSTSFPAGAAPPTLPPSSAPLGPWTPRKLPGSCADQGLGFCPRPDAHFGPGSSRKNCKTIWI